MSLLVCNNITKDYHLNRFRFGFGRSRRFEAIKDINFELKAGETLAIVGESGSGKSTLARQIIGIEKATKGEVILDGVKLKYNSRKHRKLRFSQIRMIFQNPYESLNPKARIGSTLNEVLLINTDLSATQRRQKIADTLHQVGLLPEHQFRYPHMFSGGQRQRIAIARAIILEPKIIIADEPLSALDVSIQAQILNLLQELQEKMGISYLFISHDLNVVEHIADRVMVMYQGHVVEYGKIEQIYDQPKHPYTQTLFASTPMYRKRFEDFKMQLPQTQVKKNGSACCFSARCRLCQPDCLLSQPALTTQLDERRIACFNANENQS